MFPAVLKEMLSEPAAGKPFHIMAKPIGPKCNLDCRYCFYLEKDRMFEGETSWRMSGERLEQYVRSYIASQPDGPVTFAWQGGEPTLCGLNFFRRAAELQKRHGGGRVIENALQTNGTLLNDEWCRFFKDEGFLIGISIDGPRKLHDAYRIDRKGAGSFDDVMRGMELLKRHDVAFNTLTCVHRGNMRHPLDVYRFLRGAGSRHQQFIPIVERRADAVARDRGLTNAPPPELDREESSAVTSWSVEPKAYGEFMLAIFERWVRQDVGKVYVQMFDTMLGKWLGFPGGLCVFDETCGEALAMEHDGSVYSCDHYVYPENRLGRIGERTLREMVDDPKQRKFGADKRDQLPGQCRRCEFRFACNGGCPKHRFLTTIDGEPGLNYLCEGYFHFYRGIDPYMKQMARLYQNGRPPAEIMAMLKKNRG